MVGLTYMQRAAHTPQWTAPEPSMAAASPDLFAAPSNLLRLSSAGIKFRRLSLSSALTSFPSSGSLRAVCPGASPLPRRPNLPRTFAKASKEDLDVSTLADDHVATTSTKMGRNNSDALTDLEFCSLALSPLDGRYSKKVNALRPYLSEYGLIYYRVMVEVKWLIKLSQVPEIKEVPPFTDSAISFFEGIIKDFSLNDVAEVKEIEKVTNHDVKAVEYFLKRKCSAHPEISKVLEFFHFACTSEDINNLAHGLMLKEALNAVIFPTMVNLCEAIFTMSKEYATIPMLSRTHGQTASPTTLGKEMLIFASRLSEQGKVFPKIAILGKFAGAVGNYSAHIAAYPDLNWPVICGEFVKSLGLIFNPYVTQIEPHDYIARICNAIIEFNNILMDFNRDIWAYISLGYFKQMPKAGEIGSSTMPHKINPIDFENSEGNLSIANGLLSSISMKVPISRMQRDLSDSTVLRNLGAALGYSLLSYKSTLQGIPKLQVNEVHLHQDLDKSWEVLAEPIQTVMRRYGIPEPYEKLKELTRGTTVTREGIAAFIDSLDLPVEVKLRLRTMSPQSYVGAAPELAKSADHLDLSQMFRI